MFCGWWVVSVASLLLHKGFPLAASGMASAETPPTGDRRQNRAETADPFMTAARGRFPISSDSGSAASWFGANEVPLPDREFGTLWWWALAGLNHFYLRSVLPGLFKFGLLIVGGILAISRSPIAALPIVAFGVWWAWDILQLATEKERVIAYGMSTPFDSTTGIGQGMIVDGTTQYRQRSDFVAWQLMSVLGPLGVDALLQGRPALFVRKLFDTLIFSSFGSGFVKGWINGSVSDTGLFFLFIFTALFGFFVLLPWITTVSALGHPTTMFQEGIQISPAFEKFLNYFDSWTGGFGPNTQSEVRREFGFATVPGADLRRDFKIERHDPAAKAEAATGGGGQETQTWPASLALGNAIIGPIAALVGKIVLLFRFGTEAYYAAAKMSRGEIPEIPTAGLPIPKGLIDPKKLDALKKAGSAFEQATAGKGLAGGLPSNDQITAAAKEVLAGKLGGIASAAEGALTGKLGGIASAAEGALTGLVEKSSAPSQKGGAYYSAEPTWESVVLGGTVAALAAGGVIKATVDYLVRE